MPATMAELAAELQRNTGVTCSGQHRVAAYAMPLVHRCGSKRVEELLANLDHTTALVPGVGSSNRAALGLSQHVFQWLGPCAYPETALILIWETSHDATLPGTASPWDTGGLMTKGTTGKQLTQAQASLLLATYSHDLTAAREYLACVLESSFAEAGDYLEGNPPSRWYPGWDVGTVPSAVLPAAHTFEARRPCPVPVLDGLLAAVVDEAAFATTPRLLRRLRTALATVEARYERCRAPERCDQAARRFLWQHLRDLGAL